jgi:enoyl-CoA hydratase
VGYRHRELPATAPGETGTEAMEFIQYDVVDQVAVITLDRADKANAQHRGLLTELDGAFETATADENVHVIVLQANGKHFSAGHDLTAGGLMTKEERAVKPFTVETLYNTESQFYFGFSMKWRNLPKPTIAAVQGKCVAAGLMLCWPCDLIIAADNAEFSDPTARMGLAGVEYMAHVWEFGLRKAKELLFRSTAITAQEALELGMVNKVVPLDSLRDETMTWANEIAQLQPIMLRLLKRSLNATQDAQGFTTSLGHAFDIHELAHGVQFSMRAANPDAAARPPILETMRAANKEIEERERAAAAS